MKNILFVSLGCDKNSVDSEKMIGLLAKSNFNIVDDESEADIVIVNTCCFIGDAKEESIDALIEYGNLKKEKDIILIAAGCLAQRYSDEIKKDLPEVDGIIGTMSYDKIVDVINEIESNKSNQSSDNNISIVKDDKKIVEYRNDINSSPMYDKFRIQITPGHYNYLKIAEGCNKNCSYCIIPKVRGEYRSFELEDIVSEAKDLTNKGCKEIILVAQETTMYGVDLYSKKTLPELIDKLCQIDKLKWLRILYMYPEEITDEILDAMSRNSKVCHYLDLPIQHCNNEILKTMGRRTNKEELISKINNIRDKMPDVVLRTSLITGFPGETSEEHSEMLEFIKEIKFDRLGCFKYSREEGTKAALMDNQVDEDTKEIWYNEIMDAQQLIAFDKADSSVDKIYEVLIEGKLVGEDVYVGRTRMDAPNVDGYIFVNSDVELDTGDLIKAKIVSSSGYDLVGEYINEEN